METTNFAVICSKNEQIQKVLETLISNKATWRFNLEEISNKDLEFLKGKTIILLYDEKSALYFNLEDFNTEEIRYDIILMNVKDFVNKFQKTA